MKSTRYPLAAAWAMKSSNQALGLVGAGLPRMSPVSISFGQRVMAWATVMLACSAWSGSLNPSRYLYVPFFFPAARAATLASVALAGRDSMGTYSGAGVPAGTDPVFGVLRQL